MKVINDHVIHNMDTVVLQVVPVLSKHRTELEALIGDKFQYRGEDVFRHLNTGKDYILAASCFLDSQRFYWEGKRIKGVKTATVAQIKAKAMGRNPLFRSRKKNILAGTIFTDYYVKGSVYVVVLNDGSELEINKNLVSILVDLDTPMAAKVAKPKVQPQVVEALPVSTDTVPDDFSVESVQTFKIKGLDIDFKTKEEAQWAAEILKAAQAKKLI